MLTLRLLAILLTSIDVQVDLLDGTSKSGTITSLDSDAIQLVVEEQTTSIPLADVIGVTSRSVESAGSAPADLGLLTLTDGSRLAASLTALTAQSISAESATAGSLTMPRPSMRAIRLGAANAAWEDDWQSFQERDHEDDLLILKKRDGSGLDFYGGVISTTTEETVEFVLDGDTVPVPRTRIYGLIFRAEEDNDPGPVAVRLIDGTELLVTGPTVSGDSLQVQASWKQTLTLPLTSVHSIDFTRGRFHYLSDLDPVKETYFGTHPQGSLLEELLKADDVLGQEARNLWKMHRDQVPMGPFGPLPLTLRGRVYRKGLWLFPHCRLDYALDGRYASLQAVAGVDDEVAFNCSGTEHTSRVGLTILADGDKAWEQLIDAPADPVTIQLDVTGVRTLSIIVDFGDDDSACDFLDLADARLLLVP